MTSYMSLCISVNKVFFHSLSATRFTKMTTWVLIEEVMLPNITLGNIPVYR